MNPVLRFAPLVMALFASAIPARAQVRETWRRVFDFGTPYSSDLVHAIANHPAGGYVIAGSTLSVASQFGLTNPLCVRLDANGNVLWSRSFTGDPQGDSVWAMAVAPSGNIYCASSPSDYGDIRLLKYDAGGNQQWVGGPFGGPDTDAVRSSRLVVDAAENTFVGGTQHRSIAVSADMLVLSWDSAGNQRFARVIDGPAGNGDNLHALCADPSGNIIAVGSMDGVQSGSTKLGLAKLDSAGNVLWIRTRTEGAPTDDHFLYDVVCDAAGNVYACGAFGQPPTQLAGVLVAYDPAGQFLWSVQIPGGGNALAMHVVIDRAGDIVVGASTNGDRIIAKYAPDGTPRWNRTYPGFSLWAMHAEASGDITVAGATATQIVTGWVYDMVIQRLSASGDVRWTRTIDHNGSSDLVEEFVIAADGRIAVTGETHPPTGPLSLGPPDLLVVELQPQSRPFCFGDGIGTACPCGNSSTTSEQAGCLNSTGVGAQLLDSGDASVASDTLVLTATGVPSSTLFFQGTATTSGGAGAAFGDGLRCVGGTIVRLRTVTPTGSSASYPSGPGATPIHVAGSTAAGDVRHYQCWYRNAAAFCTPSTFNLTQGMTVTWAP